MGSAKVDYTNVLSQYVKIEAGFNGNYSFENTPNSHQARYFRGAT